MLGCLFMCLPIQTKVHMGWEIHSARLYSDHMTHFNFPVPEKDEEQIKLISVTQIDGQQVLQRLVLFNSTESWLLKKNADITKR